MIDADCLKTVGKVDDSRVCTYRKLTKDVPYCITSSTDPWTAILDCSIPLRLLMIWMGCALNICISSDLVKEGTIMNKLKRHIA